MYNVVEIKKVKRSMERKRNCIVGEDVVTPPPGIHTCPLHPFANVLRMRLAVRNICRLVSVLHTHTHTGRNLQLIQLRSLPHGSLDPPTEGFEPVEGVGSSK